MKNLFKSKRYSYAILIVIGLQFYSNGQTYDFESDVAGSPPANITAANGTIVVDDDSSRTKTISPQTDTSGNIGGYNMDLFPSAKDYSITWKETYTTVGRSGFTLRSFASGSRVGIKQGYLFQVNTSLNDLRIYRALNSGYVQLSSAGLAAPGINTPRWYRATVEGTMLTFEYSGDGTTFTTMISISDTEISTAGTTQYTRGYGSVITGSFIDEVTFKSNTPLAISNIKEYQIIQRDSFNQADIIISGIYTGTPTAIEASFNGSPFMTIDANPAGGRFSGILFNQNMGQGTLSVRFANNTETMNSINNVGIGDIFVIAGQSNASGRGNTLNTYSHSSLKASLFGNDDVWKELKDATDRSSGQVDKISSDNTAGGSAWPLVATSILANHNVPVAFVPTAKGGSSILQWQPGANHADPATLYGSMFRRINEVGGNVAGVIFYQGESDAKLGTSRNDYETRVIALVDAIASDFPGTRTIIGQIGHSNFTGNDIVRAAQIAIVSANVNALLGPATYDINLADEGGDNLHFKSDADMSEYARRWYAAIDKEFYGGTNGYGPILDVKDLRYDAAADKIIVPFLDELIPAINTSSTFTTSSFILKNNNASVTISSVSIVGNTLEIVPSAALDTSQAITLTYASQNTAVDAAIYDTSNFPAQPFYEQTVYLKTLSSETFELNDFKIFPNPTSESINLLFSKNDNNVVDITIHNVLGKIIFQTSKTIKKNKINIDVSSISNGFYFLKAKTESLERTKKIVLK